MTSAVWVCPSRSRPESARRLITAWRDTGAVSQLIIRIDNDDETSDQYREVVESFNDVPVVLLSGPRMRLVPTMNEMAPELAERFDAVGFLGDDHVPRTDYWDATLASSIENGGLAYGNDLLQGEALPTAVLISADIVRTLGYFCPPGLIHLYADDAWKAWGQGIGRFYYHPDVVLEHLHFSLGKSDSDALYQEVNSPSMYETDAAVFRSYMDNDYQTDIDKLVTLYDA